MNDYARVPSDGPEPDALQVVIYHAVYGTVTLRITQVHIINYPLFPVLILIVAVIMQYVVARSEYYCCGGELNARIKCFNPTTLKMASTR